MSDKCGSDEDGDGTEQKPFKTPLRVKELSTLITVFVYYNLPSGQVKSESEKNGHKYLPHQILLCSSSYISSTNPYRLCCLLGRSHSRQSMLTHRRRERLVHNAFFPFSLIFTQYVASYMQIISIHYFL